MALNFPDSPTLNQVYTDTTSGFSYQWDGVVWQSYSPSASKNISIVDDISGSFDGVTDTFALSAYGATLAPANAQQLRVVLGGIVQEPAVDYTVSSGNIIFTTPPAGGLDCSIVSLGPALPQNNVVPVDGSVTTAKLADGSVTPAKLSTGGPYWNTGGDLNVSGVVTATSFVGDGSGITGISSVSFATTSFGLSGTPNLNVGIVTATSFVGNLTGTASTASFATTSFGLSGTPEVLVSSAGVNTTSSPTKLYVSGNSAGSVVGLGTTDANTTLDFSTGNNFSLELTGSIVLSNPTGVTTGQSGIILIQQDSVGSRTVGFGSHWDFPSATAPTLSTGANALDVLTYFVRSSTSIVTNSLIGIGTL